MCVLWFASEFAACATECYAKLVMVIAVMLAISVVFVIMVITVAITISVSISIPVVVMFKPPPIPFPIARKELLAVVMRLYPSSTFIRWQGPIPFVPTVMSADRIPIPTNPHIPRAGA